MRTLLSFTEPVKENNAMITLLDIGSFENEALENEDRSTKHPKLENEAPKSRKRSTQISKTKHPISKTKHPKLENEAPKSRKRRPLNLENEAPKNSKPVCPL